MHVLSVCLHYGKVAMVTSLDKLKNKVQIHHLHVKCFYMVKRLRKSVQFIRIYLTKSPNHNAFPSVSLACSPPELLDKIFAKILHDIVAWRYLILHIHGVIPFRLCGVCHFFSQNWLPWYPKKRSRSFICTQNDFIRWKDCESGPADPEIIFVDNKKKKLTKAKYIARSAT